jgi:aspartate ammonia-lyase
MPQFVNFLSGRCAMPKVYQFQTYDVRADIIRVSKRWGTLKGIRELGVGAQAIGGGIEVEARYLSRDIEGLTEIGFNPRMPPKPGVFK